MHRLGVVTVVGLLIAGCSSTGTPTAPSPSAQTSASPTLGATVDPSSADLDQLDAMVRTHHPAPFTTHSEAEWKAKLAEIRPKLAAAGADERLVLLASVVGLLDTHSWIGPEAGFHLYEVFFYKFSDGWFVVSAKDASLIGSRLISIGGHAIEEVEATLRPIIPHDNENGFLDNGDALSKVEYLHGTGIVTDPAHPKYVLERHDGTRATIDFAAVGDQAWAEELGVVGDLIGAAPEAIARRSELAWTRLDTKRKVLLISVNDYGDTSAAVKAMTTALNAGTANRVVLDLRYLRGGNGDFSLHTAVQAEPRVNRAGGLTVLIGRENVSAATAVAWEFDVHTKALLVGEATPARADNFTCDCFDIHLPHFEIVVTVPQNVASNGDPRPAVAPDVAMALSSGDFFAGKDPVLDAALRGISAP